MGASDWFRWLMYGPEPSVASEPLMQRTAPLDSVSSLIYDAIVERQTAFSMKEALKLPSVARGVHLLCSTAASFTPLAYRGGLAIPEQPRITRRPDPFGTRYEFVFNTTWGLVTAGEAFWRVGDRDSDGIVRSAVCLPNDEVRVEWGPGRLVRRYFWRDQPMEATQLVHVAIGRTPGELHGRSPLMLGLPYLEAVKSAEDYASGFFQGGGVPEVVIKAAAGTTNPSPDEVRRVKQTWVSSRTGPEPAVVDKDWDLQFPGIDPQRAQMQEARAYGATVVARLLGIPAALLHVETSGATITYTNPAGAVEELVKATLGPSYLAPIEAAWSDLVPSTQSVRFDLNDLQRADFAARAAIYTQLIPQGVMTPEEARAREGWEPLAQQPAHVTDPTPNPQEVPA